MHQSDLTLLVAVLAVFVVLVVWFVRVVTSRLGEMSAASRRLDARLAAQAPQLAARMAAVRNDLAAVSTQTERALWSLSRFDERVDAARAGLATRRVALDEDRARLIAARTAIIRVKKSAGLILKMLELRRAILG